MAVLLKYRQGAWWVQVNDKLFTPQRPKRKIGSKDAAAAVKAEVERLLALGEFKGFDVPKATGPGDELFEKYSLRWLTEGEVERKAHTHRFYKTNLTNHVIPAIGSVPIGLVNRDVARTLARTLRRNGHKIHVVIAAIRTASAIMTQAMEDKLVTGNPFFRMGKHTKSADELVNDAPVRAMTREQAKAVIAAARLGWPEYHAFYMVALRTGMRLGELIGLKWDVVDLDAALLRLKLAYTGKRWTTLKNRQRRDVELSVQCVEALRAHHALLQARAFALGEPMPDLVFCDFGQDAIAAEVVKLSWYQRRGNGRQGPTVNGGRKRTFGQILDGDWFSKQVHAKVMKKAACAGFTIHELRHTYASLMILAKHLDSKKGGSLEYISRQMGHSSIKVTMDVYGHFLPSDDRRAVNCLDDEDFQPSGATEPAKTGGHFGN